MRKNYIDNIRIVCILLLFPYHTCRIFTEENFYIHVREVDLCDFFVGLLDPWFMPILFLLAGMSTYLSLTKRSNRQYIRVMNYFKVSCFPIYEVHQTILIVVAYFIVRNSSLFGVQYLGILIMTFLLSILSYEMLRRFKITRWMFGIKP